MPLADAPANIQAMAAEDAAAALAFKIPRRKPTPLWRVVGGGCFEFTDGEFGCRIPDVRLDVFLAFTAEMNLYVEAVNADKSDVAFAALARAYTILYHRPRWWERWFRRIYFMNKKKAINRMVMENPARAIYSFLPVALAGYHAWVTGKKKMSYAEKESPVTVDTPKGSSSSPKSPASESETS
jgi:hypothetical protein